jgi:hypothetical protein
MCLEDFPAQALDAADLPHCSEFASKNIRDHIAEWPGHKGIANDTEQTPPNPELRRKIDEQSLQVLI